MFAVAGAEKAKIFVLANDRGIDAGYLSAGTVVWTSAVGGKPQTEWTTYRVSEHWQTGAMSRNMPWLVGLTPNAFVEIGTALAQREGIKNGAQLAVEQQSAALAKAGFKVELVPFDDQAKPDVGVANAKNLVTDPQILVETYWNSIEELLPKVDVVLLQSLDGRVHLEQVRPAFKAGKRVFIDKPIAALLRRAGHEVTVFDAMLAAGDELTGVPDDRRGGPVGDVVVRNGHRVGKTGCEVAEPRAEHHGDGGGRVDVVRALEADHRVLELLEPSFPLAALEQRLGLIGIDVDPLELPDAPLDSTTLSRDPEVGRAYEADPLVWHGSFQRPTLEAIELPGTRIASTIGFTSTCFFRPSDSLITPSGVSWSDVSVIFSSVTAVSLTRRPPRVPSSSPASRASPDSGRTPSPRMTSSPPGMRPWVRANSSVGWYATSTSSPPAPTTTAATLWPDGSHRRSR